jgi:transcriptional regulator with PAS, ATPase and Fis domain
VFEIKIPPLRERREEDILPLAEHFLHGYNRSYRREIQGISNQAADALMGTPGPAMCASCATRLSGRWLSRSPHA